MQFWSPKYLTDAFEILEQTPKDISIGGGMTHLLRFYPNFPVDFMENPVGILHVGDLSALAGCKEEHQRYMIGATTRICDLQNDDYLNRYAPAISLAARMTSTPQIRNQRTVGGEVAWASLHSPLIAALMAFNADVRIYCPGSHDTRSHEKTIDLADFYLENFERTNNRGEKILCRRADLKPRDLILKICIPINLMKKSGGFSFFKALSPKISTENPGVIVAVRGEIQNGILSHAQFVVSGVWVSTLKEEIPLEGTKLKPGIFFERLYQFCERYPFDSYRLAGPSPKQLGLMVFGLLKEGFSYFIGTP